MQTSGHYSYTKTAFSPGYEDFVRGITNPNGTGNAAFVPEEMLPQDKLTSADITLGLTTGSAIQFNWASGRSDVHIVVDLPADTVPAEKIAERSALIAQLKEANHG